MSGRLGRREVLALLLALGCSDEDEPARPAGLVFRPDEPGAGPALRLRSTSSTGGRISFEVVAAELDDIYGVAFRLIYDAAVLRFRELVKKGELAAAPELRVMARESRSGLLVAALTRVGKQPGIAGRNAALAELSFDVVARRAGRLDFVATHSRVFAASDGRMLPARFVAGALETG